MQPDVRGRTTNAAGIPAPFGDPLPEFGDLFLAEMAQLRDGRRHPHIVVVARNAPASSSLSPGLPGTIARSFTATSRLSKRSSMPSFFVSPWQMKHLSDRIGRMSRLYCCGSPTAGGAIARATIDGNQTRRTTAEDDIATISGKNRGGTRQRDFRVPPLFRQLEGNASSGESYVGCVATIDSNRGF